jgi:CRP/FNR family transcriptional regulator, cyclic AMP receptor protein
MAAAAAGTLLGDMEAALVTARVALLREDPDLGTGIAEGERATAEGLVVVPAIESERGELAVDLAAHEPSLGLLMLDGVVTLNIVVADRVASQLLGPGDVVWSEEGGDALLPTRTAHHVSERARFAVLDRTFIAAVRRWPALLLVLHERLHRQERRLAVHAAIGKLRRVEDRVLALLWHLAERWGRVTAEGVLVPLALTHETIGRLAGAERPTVTLALSDLASSGAISRTPGGGFLLDRDVPGHLAPQAALEPQSRPLAAVETGDRPPEQRPEAPRTPVGAAPAEAAGLRQRIAALDDELPARKQEAADLPERTAATRARVAERRHSRA